MISKTIPSTSYTPPNSLTLGGWSGKQFIQHMKIDGWQAINDAGKVVKSPEIASRLWIHTGTGARFEGGNMVVVDNVQVILWRGFAANECTPDPF